MTILLKVTKCSISKYLNYCQIIDRTTLSRKTEIMADKLFETIIYTKMITKKKPSTDRIETHLLRARDENNEFSIENLDIAFYLKYVRQRHHRIG